MSEKIVQLNEEVIKGQLKELVRGSVEETLNGLLEAEAEKLTQTGRYERSEQQQGYRSGHYNRNLMTTAGKVKLHVPRLKGVTLETAIIERYRRRECTGVLSEKRRKCIRRRRRMAVAQRKRRSRIEVIQKRAVRLKPNISRYNNLSISRIWGFAPSPHQRAFRTFTAHVWRIALWKPLGQNT